MAAQTMTKFQFANARQKLGLTQSQFAMLLGYEGEQARSQIEHMETGARAIRPAQVRLVRALLEGYRPKDWHEITGQEP